MSEQITDLGRRPDRTSYDLAKSLVKLEEVQKLEMPTSGAVAEVQKYLADLHIIVGQIERLDVLQDGQPKGEHR